MRAFTFVEYIDRPPQEVWDALVDLENAPRWRPMVRSMRTVDGQPIRESGEIEIVVEAFGRREKRISVSSAFEPPRRWVLHSADQPVIGGFFEFVVEPDGSRTRVTALCELQAKSFLAWLFLRIIAKQERERRRELLPNLKRYVEALPRR